MIKQFKLTKKLVTKIRLNDSRWSSKQVRAKGMRKLAILQLDTANCDFNVKLFLLKLKATFPKYAYAAADAAHAADIILFKFAVGVENILIEMKVPATKYLNLL